MHKKSLEQSCYVAGAGAFGVFFRWLQNMLAFDEAGLNEKSVFNVLVPVLIIAAAIMFRRYYDRLHRQKYYVSKDFCEALYNPGRLFTIARWAAGGLMFLGAAVLVLTTETDPNAVWIRVVAMLAALSGLAYPLVLGSANYDEFANVWLVRLGMLLPVILYAVWLVLSYKQNSYNSIAWSYALEMLVIMITMLAYFHIAGFAFFVVNERKCLFFVMLAGALCIMVLADERYLGMQMIFLASAVQMLLYNWVLLLNLKKRAPASRSETPRAEDGFEIIDH